MAVHEQFQTGGTTVLLQYNAFNILGPWGWPLMYTLKQ